MSFWNNLISQAWDLQYNLEAHGRQWIHRIGVGFIAGLFGFSLISLGFLGVVYYQFFDRGLVFLLVGSKDMFGFSKVSVPLFFNPVMHLVWGFMVVLFLLLVKKAELSTHK